MYVYLYTNIYVQSIRAHPPMVPQQAPLLWSPTRLTPVAPAFGLAAYAALCFLALSALEAFRRRMFEAFQVCVSCELVIFVCVYTQRHKGDTLIHSHTHIHIHMHDSGCIYHPHGHRSLTLHTHSHIHLHTRQWLHTTHSLTHPHTHTTVATLPLSHRRLRPCVPPLTGAKGSQGARPNKSYDKVYMYMLCVCEYNVCP